jgi:ribosomal protein L6P/L9E
LVGVGYRASNQGKIRFSSWYSHNIVLEIVPEVKKLYLKR